MPAIQEHTNRPTGNDLNDVLFFGSLASEKQEELLQGTSESPLLMVQFHSDTENDALLLWPLRVQTEELYSPAEITALRTYPVREIVWRGRRLALREEIECSIVRDDDLYVIEYKPLGIHAYAHSLHAAKRDFDEEFAVIWDDYGLAPDEELAPGGIRLKRRLREIVDRETRADED